MCFFKIVCTYLDAERKRQKAMREPYWEDEANDVGEDKENKKGPAGSALRWALSA